MFSAYRRIHAILLVSVLSVMSLAAYAQTKITFDLPAQPLAHALLAVGSQAGANVTFDPEVVKGYHAAALKGSYTVRQALDYLLKGSELTVQTTPNGSFLVVRKSDAGTPSTTAPLSSSAYTFHLPAQDLVATLHAIRIRTGRRIELGKDARAIVKGNAAVAVNGTMTPLQAIRKALVNTGLEAKVSPKGVLVVRQASPGQSGSVRALRKVVSTATVSGLSATRTATPLIEIPQSVSIFGQRRMRSQNIADLDDLMKRATGITVIQNNMLSNDFYSRGFWISAYHVDGGAPVSFITLNGVSPDMSEYSRAVILRGSDALFGGAGNPGATLNLVRKQPQAKPAVTLDQLIGSWHTYRTQLDATGPIGLDGKLLGRVVAMYDDRHFYYDTAVMRRRKLYGTVAYHPTPATTLTLGGSVELRKDIPMTTGLPRYLDGGDIHLPRSTFFGMSWQRERATSHEVFAELSHSFNERWKLRVQATRMNTSSTQFAASLNGPVQRGTGVLLGSTDAMKRKSSMISVSANAQLSGSFSIDGWTQDMLVGADYEDNRSDSVLGTYPLLGPPRLSVFDLQTYPAGEHLEFTSATPLRLKQYGLYAAFRIRALVDGLSFTAGVRESNYRRSGVTTILSPTGSLIFRTPSRNSLVHGKPTPLVGVNYDLGQHYSLYASYADIYSPPSPNLSKADGSPYDRPLDGVNLEAGIKGEWYGGRLNGSLAFFKIRQSGVPLQGSSNPSIPGCCFVGGTNRSHGFELALNGRVTHGWQIGMGYTFNVNHQATLPGNRAEPLQTQTPKHLFKLWTSYRLPGDWSRWSVGGDLHAQSRSYKNGLACAAPVDALGHCLGPMTNFRVAQGFYAVMGLRVGYRLSRKWQLAVNVDNVFDRIYYRTTGTPISGSWYGMPRNIMVSLHGTL